MPNIADIIEQYIKARLSQSGGGTLVIRRNELAEKFRCVPSQINYVLSTRFSFNRGYIIETRRGGGGFVRIVRIPLEDSGDLLDILYDRIGETISLNEAMNLIHYLHDEDLVTKREELLMENVLEITAPHNVAPDMDKRRALILKSMLMVLVRHAK